MIPLSVPHLFEEEKKYVNSCLDSGWISSAGEYVNLFENKFKSYIKTDESCAVMNGTSGLHLCLKALGLGPGDCVLTNNLTFVATLNAITYTGAEPILVDVNQETWQIDETLLEHWLEEKTFINDQGFTTIKNTNRQIKAIVPVYVLGNAYNIDSVVKMAEKYNLLIVEDSTEALGTFIKNEHAGTFGNAGVFSFNGNKIISTGGGGMIVSKCSNLINKIRHLSTTAKVDPIKYYHDEIGYNYRLVNVLAALGVGQLENINKILEKKEVIFKQYHKFLNLDHVQFQKSLPEVNWNHWLVTIKTNRSKELQEFLEKENIQTRPFWTPMNQLPMFKDKIYITNNDVSAKLFAACTSIPCSFDLTVEQQEKVIESINRFFSS